MKPPMEQEHSAPSQRATSTAPAKRAMDLPVPLSAFASWLASGERGISSEAIVARITGTRVGRGAVARDHPHDPSDFRRCELLLREVPEARAALHLVSDMSPEWAALVERWNEVVATAEAESPECFTAPLRHRSPAPATFRLMRSILDASRAAA